MQKRITKNLTLKILAFLIAVFLLSGVVVRLVKEYFAGEGKES